MEFTVLRVCLLLVVIAATRVDAVASRVAIKRT